jgi:NADH:ubiquinone oxidoreductase subunit 5 (subunit L)/multisubunit Na+/H+ antiporter MnhA subunit
MRKQDNPRPIWFLAWFLAAVATLGCAFLPMFYLLIDKRNKHFAWFSEIESKTSTGLEQKNLKEAGKPHARNAAAWAISVVFVFPAFVITYILTRDLLIHEKQETTLFERLDLESMRLSHSMQVRKLLILSIVTFGLGIFYWLHIVINAFNNHFKEQWQIQEQGYIFKQNTA